MDIIYARPDLTEIGVITAYKAFDCVSGIGTKYEDNDFELQIPAEEWERLGVEKGGYIYIPGTEYGGAIKGVISDGDDAKLVGSTWRGALAKMLINSNSYTISGEANAEITKMISGRGYDYYHVPEKNSGIILDAEVRYVNVLEAINNSFNDAAARLNIFFSLGRVVAEAVPALDYSGLIDISDDYGITLKVTDDDSKAINHFVGVGKDGLKVERWMSDGEILTSKPIGLVESSDFFESENQSDAEKLAEDVEKKLKEAQGTHKVDADFSGEMITADLGDTVAGRDRITGTYVKSKISKKTLHIENGITTIKYEVE